MSPNVYYLINLLGGVTLFLYGVEQSTEAFRSSFSNSTREFFAWFTRKKPQAMLFGVLLSAIAQGSTVSTSIAISLVDVGMMTLAGSVVVMMGASIGGTFVTFLVSLDIVSLAPLFLAVSFLMSRVGHGRVAKAGCVFHAISLILIGMLLLQLGVKPLLNNPGVRTVVIEIARRPFVMFIAAVLGTAILQSSASVMALAVAIAASGALPQSAVFPVALGSHLGSTVTMLLAAMGGRHNARMLGIATFIYKLAGVVIFVPFIPSATHLLERLGCDMPTNIVLAQLLLVVLNALVFYPCPDFLIRATSFLLSRRSQLDLRTPVYLDEQLLDIPSIAVRLLAKEMIRLANYIEAYLQMLILPEKSDPDLKKRLPDGIRELTDACEQYMYEIRPAFIAGDVEAVREYRTISYAMMAFKEASHLVTGRLFAVIENNGVNRLASEIGSDEWSVITHFMMRAVRDAFHSFALGDADLAREAIETDAKFDSTVLKMRARILSNVSDIGPRQETAILDFVNLASRMIHSAIEVARGDAASASARLE